MTDQRIRFRHTRQPIVAVEWRVGPADDFRNGVSEIRIETRGQRDGSELYAVTMRGWTATKDGEWEYEPIPSSRDAAYLSRCRWDDWELAALMADRMLAHESGVSPRGADGMTIEEQTVPMRLAEHLAVDAVAPRCELVTDYAMARCSADAVAIRWEDGFADSVCQYHATTAVERGEIVVYPRRHDGQRDN